MTVTKRVGRYKRWSPLYIGTHRDPYYDERLSWEGKQDRMTQAYLLCVKNYNFMVLDNVFLVQKPGFRRKGRKEPKKVIQKQDAYIRRTIAKEADILFGKREKCTEIITVAKRTGTYKSWEPIYVGTHLEPYYDERLSWDGMKDKMLQAYVLCVRNYDFMVLSNSFLVHKPGIKRGRERSPRDKIIVRQGIYVRNDLTREARVLFGDSVKCKV